MQKLGEHLKGFKVEEHKPSLPAVKQTPKPVRTKVTSNPVRTPVNKQAALVVRPNRSWVTQPLPPEKLKTPESIEVDRLKAELKAERNAHAATRDALGQARKEARVLRHQLDQRVEQVATLLQTCRQKDELIKQLEDIKL